MGIDEFPRGVERFMKPPKKSEKKLVHTNPFSKVFHVEAEFNSFKKQYYVTHFGPRVGLVAVQNEKILLVRQYRLLPDRLTLELTARLDMRGIDWSKTPAFMVPSGDCGYIRLNLKDRERHGIIGPPQIPALLNQITSGLLSFRDPDGEPTIKNVELATDNLHLNSYTHPFPDLIVHWNERLPTHLAGVQSADFGTVPSPGWGSGRTGEHCDGAWVLIVPGSSTLKAFTKSPHIVDIAATVCEFLGVDAQGLSGNSLLTPNLKKTPSKEEKG